MTKMFENWFGPTLGSVAGYIAILLLLLIALAIAWFVYKIVRRPRFAGGKRSIQARLAVTDAAAIDSRRRLVLVRRDEVEHLIMIGGPSDIVIESDIRRVVAARPRTTAETGKAKQAQTVEKPKAPPQVTQKPPEKPKPAPLKLTPESPPPPPRETQQPNTSPQPTAKSANPLSAATKVGASAGALAGAASATITSASEKISDTAAGLQMPKPSSEVEKPTDKPSSPSKNDVDALLEEIALPDK